MLMMETREKTAMVITLLIEFDVFILLATFSSKMQATSSEKHMVPPRLGKVIVNDQNISVKEIVNSNTTHVTFFHTPRVT